MKEQCGGGRLCANSDETRIPNFFFRRNFFFLSCFRWWALPKWSSASVESRIPYASTKWWKCTGFEVSEKKKKNYSRRRCKYGVIPCVWWFVWRDRVNDGRHEFELHRRYDDDASRWVAREEAGRCQGGEEEGERGVEIAWCDTGVGSSLQRLYNSPCKNEMQQLNEPQGREWKTGSAFDWNVESKFCACRTNSLLLGEISRKTCLREGKVARVCDKYLARRYIETVGRVDKRKMCILIIDRATLVDRCRSDGGKKKKSMLFDIIVPHFSKWIFNFSISLLELANIRVHW